MRNLLTAAVSILILAISYSANAHINVEPKSAFSGEYVKLTFRVGHGCDSSPTTKLTLTIPEGFTTVRPQIKPGWKITVKKEKLATPIDIHGTQVVDVTREITWSGLLTDDYMDEFAISLRAPDREGVEIFKVFQTCKKGTADWSENAMPGHSGHNHENKAMTKFPAPVVRLEKRVTK